VLQQMLSHAAIKIFALGTNNATGGNAGLQTNIEQYLGVNIRP
jgi:hypothetical protein